MTSTDPTNKDVSILSFFFENDNKPTHATGITKSVEITPRWSGIRCKYLESVRILSHIMRKPPRQKGKTEYYFILDTMTALAGIVSILNHRHDAREEFMRSAYFHNRMPELMERLDDLMPLHDVPASKSWAEDYKGSRDIEDSTYYLADTYNRKENPNNTLCCVVEVCKDRAHVTYDLNGLSDEDVKVIKGCLIKHCPQLSDDYVIEDTTEKPVDHWSRIRYTADPKAMDDKIILIVKTHLSDEDKQCLAMSLEDNWLTLKFVLHFISATHNERDRILDQLHSDADDPQLSPWAAWEHGFHDALTRVKFKVCSDEDLDPVYAERKKECQSEPLHNWIEFFNQLERLNSNYRFLFD